MNEQNLGKPSEILMKMLAKYSQTENNSIKKIQLSDSVSVEVVDGNHVCVISNEIDKEKDTGAVEIVLCTPNELPKVEIFEVNTFEEDEVRRIKNRILWKYQFGG